MQISQRSNNHPAALVTGASRGVGAAIAEALAAEGFDLYLLCRKELTRLQDTATELSDTYGVHVTTFTCDVTNPEDVDNVFSSIPRLDVLVNNAAIAHIGLLQDMSLEEWNKVLSTNLSSLFLFCKKAIPLFLQSRSGKILNISSVWGSVGASMEVAYSASKGGVNAFTKALAKELAPSGIAVNALSLGAVDTDMNRCFSEEELSVLAEEIPAGRMATPKEAGEMALSILRMPTYTTGSIFTMDGGWQ